MSNPTQAPKDTLTTLDDLKRAISYATTDVDDFDSDAARERARGDAWRTAFEWRDAVWLEPNPELYAEGMRLIREKLQS